MVFAVCFSFLLHNKRGETEKSKIRKLLRRWLCVNCRVTHVVQHRAGSLIGKDFAKIVTPVWPVTRCRAARLCVWVGGQHPYGGGRCKCDWDGDVNEVAMEDWRGLGTELNMKSFFFFFFLNGQTVSTYESCQETVVVSRSVGCLTFLFLVCNNGQIIQS